MTFDLFLTSCLRVPGAGGGRRRSGGPVCGGPAGGAGEGGVAQRPAGRSVPQFGQPRRRVAAAPQLRWGRSRGATVEPPWSPAEE